MTAETIAFEILKALVAPLATVALAWIVGNRLTATWGFWQKRREQTQSTANEYYKLYGEFFTTWKLWNYTLKEVQDSELRERRWLLLQRAATAEGGVEALFVKITSERPLLQEEIEVLGRFRQGYQTLRQAIRDSRPLDWHYSSHPQYRAFKILAAKVSQLVSTVDHFATPTREASEAAIESITANRWEGVWHELPQLDSRDT